MSKFNNEEKANEAAREVKMRYEVYGRMAGGQLMPSQERRIAIMEEIAAEYRKLAEADRLI
jgi:hypothetical protein